MSRAYGFLTDATDFTLPEAARRLRARFPNATVTEAGGQVVLSIGDWQTVLWVNDGPEVAGEAVGLSGRIPGLEPGEGDPLERSRRRVEATADGSDPFLEHAADFTSVVEVLKTFRGLTAVDPHEHTLL